MTSAKCFINWMKEAGRGHPSGQPGYRILEPVCTRAFSCACAVDSRYGSLRALSGSHRSSVRALCRELYPEEHSCLWGIVSDLLSFGNPVHRNLREYRICHCGLCGRNPVLPDIDRKYLYYAFGKLFYFIL